MCVCVERWSGVNRNSKHNAHVGISVNMRGMNVKNASKCLGLSLKIVYLSKIKQISYN